jgi:endonuclease YncB( thermonuclease family)
MVSEGRRGQQIRVALVLLLVIGSGAWLIRTLFYRDAPPVAERMDHVKVKSVLSGQVVKIKHGDRLTYAGIRAPYEQEPLFAEARRRNAELVEGKELRLRFDQQDRRESKRKEYLVAYAFVDGEFVNERLVREGLAYVRMTPDSRQYAERLLAAQSEARRKRVGLWNELPSAPEASYPADPKYGLFHRPTCEEVPKIKPERLARFTLREDAFDAGIAPCPKCQP